MFNNEDNYNELALERNTDSKQYKINYELPPSEISTNDKVYGDNNSFKFYLSEIGKVSLLSRKEEKEYAKRVAEGDNQAKVEMIEANLRLVIKIAKRYINRGLPFLDLVQEGNIGLMKAVDKFDLQRGCKFSTHAIWWIRQGITRALAEKAQTIRIPVHALDALKSLHKHRSRLFQEKEREPKK